MLITEKDIFMHKNNYNKVDVARLSVIPYTTIDGLYIKGDENINISTLRKLAPDDVKNIADIVAKIKKKEKHEND